MAALPALPGLIHPDPHGLLLVSRLHLYLKKMHDLAASKTVDLDNAPDWEDKQVKKLKTSSNSKVEILEQKETGTTSILCCLWHIALPKKSANLCKFNLSCKTLLSQIKTCGQESLAISFKAVIPQNLGRLLFEAAVHVHNLAICLKEAALHAPPSGLQSGGASRIQRPVPF